MECTFSRDYHFGAKSMTPSDGAHELPATQYLATWQPISLPGENIGENVALLPILFTSPPHEIVPDFGVKFPCFRGKDLKMSCFVLLQSSKKTGYKSSCAAIVDAHFWIKTIRMRFSFPYLFCRFLVPSSSQSPWMSLVWQKILRNLEISP